MQQLAIDEKYDCHWLICVHEKVCATTKQKSQIKQHFGHYVCVQQILCGKQCVFNQQQGKTNLQRAINETGCATITVSSLTQWHFEDFVNF